jgi:hypothetical protein
MMWKRSVVASILLTAALLLLPRASQADTAVLTVSGCGSCFGLTYTLTVVGTPGGTTFSVTMNASGTVSGLASGITRIGSVNFKIGTDVTAADITSAPGGDAHWEPDHLNVNATSNGCTGSGNGFVCNRQDFSGGIASLSNGAVINYDWTWAGVTVAAGSAESLFGPGGTAPLRIEYENDNGDLSGQLLSETATVPEPATMLLLWSGLLGVVGFSRLRTFKKS